MISKHKFKHLRNLEKTNQKNNEQTNIIIRTTAAAL